MCFHEGAKVLEGGGMRVNSLSEFQEAGSLDVGNHLRERASAGANHRITFYVRIKTSTALVFAFLLRYYSQPSDIGESLNY